MVICSPSRAVKVQDGRPWAGRWALQGGTEAFMDSRGLPGIVWDRWGLWRTAGYFGGRPRAVGGDRSC